MDRADRHKEILLSGGGEEETFDLTSCYDANDEVWAAAGTKNSRRFFFHANTWRRLLFNGDFVR